MNSLADSSPVSLETVLLVFGGLLMGGALISGLARRSFLSLAALFVVAGFVLGDGGLEVLDFAARSGFVHDLAIVALVVILFRDGLEVEAEMLQSEWHLPFRKLALAMPITVRARSRCSRTGSSGSAGSSRSCSARCSPRPTRCSPPRW